MPETPKALRPTNRRLWAPAKVSGEYLAPYLAAKNVVSLPLRARHCAPGIDVAVPLTRVQKRVHADILGLAPWVRCSCAEPGQAAGRSRMAAMPSRRRRRGASTIKGVASRPRAASRRFAASSDGGRCAPCASEAQRGDETSVEEIEAGLERQLAVGARQR